MIIVRVWKDGQPCLGMARLRPLKGGQIDMSRFVNIGYVTSFDTKPQLEAMANFFGQALTQDFKGINSELMKKFKDQFVPIEPGSYVMTNITCTSGRNKSWIGDDRANPFASESGSATPILGANVINVRPGEILDAGIIEIRSDDVGSSKEKPALSQLRPRLLRNRRSSERCFLTLGKSCASHLFGLGSADQTLTPIIP
ncbi:hypothetical protein ACETIH_19975 [Microvirga arabica]|uniref:Uncharacterized protein n=1 Tax=Microvirga arabica TaxID=1128671 RepID=A0ABV6YCG0_9HYPH